MAGSCVVAQDVAVVGAVEVRGEVDVAAVEGAAVVASQSRPKAMGAGVKALPGGSGLERGRCGIGAQLQIGRGAATGPGAPSAQGVRGPDNDK